MKIYPIENSSFGAVVTEFSIAEALQSTDPDTIRRKCNDAFEDYGLLIFREQELSPGQELAFAKWFPFDEDASIEERAGPYSESFLRWKLPEHPEIQVQGWGDLQDHHGVSGTMKPKVSCHEWHTDGVHDLDKPPVYTSMYALQVPPEGGETLFASGYNAWEALPEADRKSLWQRRVIYTSLPHRMSEDGCLALPGDPNVINGPGGFESHSHVRHTSHPMFRLHPCTGRVALSVAPMFMHAVEEIDSHTEAAALLARILKLAVARSYRHKFAKGDLVIWDNRCMLHSATPLPSFPPPGHRIIHRIRMSSKEVPVCPSDPSVLHSIHDLRSAKRRRGNSEHCT